jgi:hypothetical protein
MIVPRSHRIPQCGEPRVFHQSGVGSELRAGHAPRIEQAGVFGICSQSTLLYCDGLLHQLFDLRFHLRVWSPVRCFDKAVVRIFSGIEHSDAVKLMKQNRGQQMIDRERVVGMPPHHLLKIMHRGVILKVLEMVESGDSSRVLGTERKILSRSDCGLRRSLRVSLRQQEKPAKEQ